MLQNQTSRLLALFFITISFCSLQAQDSYLITGKVSDEVGNPLPGASVVDRNSGLGITTDQAGNFRLEVNQLPVYLEIRFIGYSTHYQTLQEESFSKKRAVLNIKMKTLTEILETVTVESKAYENFYTHRTITVIDFAFVDENTLLLLEDQNDYSLALINESEDSLAHFSLDFKGVNLQKDCMDHHYVQGKDSLHSFRVGNSEIIDVGSIASEYYDKKIEPCVASNAYNLYYQFHGFENQMVEYHQTAFGTGNSLLIRRILDEEYAFGVAEYGQEAREKMLTSPREGYDMMAWYNRILKQPHYSPLFANASGAVIFDHLIDSAIVLDASGSSLEQHYIQHHKLKGFAGQVLYDEANGEYFARFNNGGNTELAQLSSSNFRVLRRTTIKGVEFPEKLKVRNGVAYFIAHDQDDYNRSKLYRQKL